MGFGAVPNPVDHPGVDTGENYVGDAVWSDGPYKITTYNPSEGGSLVLERNDKWTAASDDYRGAYPDKWEVDFGLDLKIIDQRLMQCTGNDAFAIDYGGIQPENLTTVFSDSHTAAAAFTGRAFSDFDPYTRYYWINTRRSRICAVRAGNGSCSRPRGTSALMPVATSSATSLTARSSRTSVRTMPRPVSGTRCLARPSPKR